MTERMGPLDYVTAALTVLVGLLFWLNVKLGLRRARKEAASGGVEEGSK